MHSVFCGVLFMLNKSLFKLTAVLLTVLISITLLSGCNNKKYVYGTNSDFIEVSHPDKPNVNKFSQEEPDTSSDDSISSQNISQSDSKETKSSDDGNSANNNTSSTANNDSNSNSDSSINNNSSGNNVSRPEESSGTDNKTIGDQSPVVTFQ